MKINTLTKKQQDDLPRIRDEWIKTGLSTERADRPRAEAGVVLAYNAAGLEPPTKFIWCDSPYEGASIVALLQCLQRSEVKTEINQVEERVRAQVWDQVRDQVEDQVRDQVEDQVWSQVGAQVQNQVWDQVWGQIGVQVWHQVEDQVQNQVLNQVADQVWDQVEPQIQNQVVNQVWDQVRNQVEPQIQNQVVNQVWDQVEHQVAVPVGARVWDQVMDQVWGQVEPQVQNQVIGQVWDQVENQVWDQVWDQVVDQVGAQVRNRVMDHVRNQVWSQVGTQVRNQVVDQVEHQVGAQVRDQVVDQVGAQVRDQVVDQVKHQVVDQVKHQVVDQVMDQVKHQVIGQVWDQVENQVWYQVWDQVGAQVRNQVEHQVALQVQNQISSEMLKRIKTNDVLAAAHREELHKQLRNAVYGSFDAGWLSYFHAIGNLGVEETQRLHGLAEVAKSCGWWWPRTNVAVMTERPLAIHRDEQNRLHNETGPAILYRDGFSVYAVNGVRVPKKWIEQKTTIHPSEIIKAENVEQRVAGAKLIGWPRMLSELDCRVIDDSGSDDIGQLIELTLPGLSEPGRFLKAKCPRNGTIVEGVPYISDIDGLPIETALHAQAWRIGDPLSDYQHPPRRT